MTSTDLINGVLEREGGFRNVPGDRGGPTNFGVTAAEWGRYLMLGRDATALEVQKRTRQEAFNYYLGRLVLDTPFKLVANDAVKTQLIDWGVNSGEPRVIRWLQRLLGVPVSSTMDDRTVRAANAAPPLLLNEALMGERMRMIRGGVKDGTIPASDEAGLLNRAQSFTEIHV